MDKKQTIGWGQLLMLLFMCRVFTLMTFVPLIAEGRSLTVQLEAAAVSVLIQAVLLIPAIALRGGVTEAAIKENKAFGITAAALYFIFFLFYSVNSLLHFQNFLSSGFFPTAEASVWIGILLIVCVYCGCLGIEALGRSAVILFWLFIISLAVMTVSAAGNFDAAHLSFGIKYSDELFPAVMDDLSRSGEICAAVFLAKNVSKDLRRGIYGLLGAKLLLTAAVSVLIAAVLGDYAQYTDYPFLTVGAFGETGSLQRGDSLYLIVWTITAVINIALFLHILSGLMGEVFPRLKYRTLISAAAAFIVSLFFTLTDRSFSETYDIFCSGWAVIFLTGAVPLAVLILRRRGGKKTGA